jgi:hypothetical protein
MSAEPFNDQVRQVTVVISDEAYQALRQIADARDTTLEEALADALANEQVIAREIAGGGRILIEKPDKSLRELVSG